MDVAKPYKFIGFGAMYVTKPCKLIGFGAIKPKLQGDGSPYNSGLV